MLGAALHMMRGTPYVYQGEEIGITNAYFNDISDYVDVESTNIYDVLLKEGKSKEEVLHILQERSRDNARTPMQWDATANAGFTSGTPWIGVNPNYTEINAQAQTDDAASVFSYYRELIRLRHTMPVMVDGRFELLQPDNDQVFAYMRKGEDGTGNILVFCNFTKAPAPLPPEAAAAIASGAKRLIGNYADLPSAQLRPYEALVLA
jgi:glycosidase